MKINCIVIEDEPLALKKIEGFINQVDYLNLYAGFDNAVKAIGYLKNNSVDLIFLDIRMKKLSGIQFLESLKSTPKVIITSAYDEYALKGYELDVSDYLLKPFPFERFLKSVEKIYADIDIKNKDQNPSYIFIKTEHRIEKVELQDILFIRGRKDYLQICMVDRKIMTLQTFKNIIQILPDKEFVRVHNSFIISIAKIDNIEKNRIKIGENMIPISDGYKANFYKLLKEQKQLI